MRRLPQIKERWNVRWRDGKPHPADIIDIKTLQPPETSEYSPEGNKHGGTTNSSGNEQESDKKEKGGGDNEGGSSKSGQPMYYVHYIEFDRRLDGWIHLEQIKLEDGPQPKFSGQGHNGDKRRVTTRMKRKYEELSSKSHGGGDKDGLDPTLAELEREHEEITKVKNVQKVVIGKYEVETWYFSPYPDDYSKLDTLYVCEFCLKYIRQKCTLRKHRSVCRLRHPPGDEIYRETAEGGQGCGLSVFEVDGKTNKVYCQNLCLLSKLFLDHKTLYYDVDPFMFFVLCEVDDEGAHIVGYFSKEKFSTEEYNLACILTFPPYQRKGYGKLLISLSYEISRRENRVGSPEKPLSDLGKLSYRSYWTHVLMTLLQDYDGEMSIRSISLRTAIKTEDIISTLQSLNLIKYWKGQHIIAVSRSAIRDALAKSARMKLCKPECLTWPVQIKKEPAPL